MSQVNLPWIQRPASYYGQLRSRAQALLFAGGFASLLLAVGGYVLLEATRLSPRTPVLIITAVLPIVLGALGSPLGLLKQSPVLIAVLGAPIGAGIVNYLILTYTPIDPYVFGILLLCVGPALGGVTLFAAGLAVTLYREIGRILPKIAIFLFLGGIVALVLVVWAHAELFRYTDRLVSDPAVNVASNRTFLGGELTIAELQTGFGRPLAVLAYPLWPLQFSVVRDLLGLGGILGFINLIPLFAIWWERKVAGRIQSRLGPMRVGGWHGWAQSFADGIKLIFKEDFVPPQGDRALFRLAPYLAFVPAVCAFLALPFGTYWIFRELDVALIFILAMLGIEVIGVIIAGWASNNKWSVYGAMREACQMVSYEIPMGMALLIPVMTAGTLNLVHIVDGFGAADGGTAFAGQAGGFWTWLVFRNPFCFMAAFVYYVASLASCKRAPFDLPESESELVAGFHTEYSGFRWSLFFFAEYAAMYVVCALSIVLFFGGWYSPIPLAWKLTGDDLLSRAVNGVMFNGPLWFVFKSGLLLYVQIWIRWTLPRIRIDQVLYSCIQVLLPLTMLLLLGNTFWVLMEQQGWGWFGALNVVLNAALSLFGVAVLVICLYWIVHGYMNNKRLVGTLAIDHLPGA